MRITNEEAYVLHTRPYLETSEILEIFSKNFGRISLLAKGAKSKKTMQKGRRLLFTPLLVSFVGSIEKLLTLTQVESLQASYLVNDNNALACGFYLNELLMHFMPKAEAYPELFTYYHLTIQSVADKNNMQETLRLFEKQLLKAVGYELKLKHEANSNELVQANQLYYYEPHSGPIRLKNNVQSAYVKLRGQSLIDYHHEDFQSVTTLREIKQLTAFIINYYLHGRKLFSRSLLRSNHS